MAPFKRLNMLVNEWFFRPEANAAGRLGIFRIVWSIFVLSMALATFQEDISQIPVVQWYPVQALVWLKAPPSANVISFVTIIRIIAVTFVLFGYRTRLATGLTLAAAIFLEGLTFSFGKQEHNDTIAYIYIPAIMLLYNWGQTYSIDALIKQQRTQKVTDVYDGSWHHGWTIKLVLLILGILYFGAAYIKIVDIHWLIDPRHLSNLLLGRNITHPNVLRYWVGSNYQLVFALQILTLLFEGLFLLALVNQSWRIFFLSAGVLFHFSIYVMMWPEFHQLVFVYAIFLDWQKIGEWLRLPELYERLKTVSPNFLIILASCVAAILVVLRLFILPINTLQIIEPVWIWVIWGISVPLAIVGLIYSIPRLFAQIMPK